MLLYGQLGAGKSVLARGIAAGLGVNEVMASPTFTLMQPYKGKSFPVYHFDLYRLSDSDELFAAGLDEFIGTDGIAIIEWPQQADVCPDRRIEIDIDVVDCGRLITLEAFGIDKERTDSLYAAVNELTKAQKQ